MQEFPKLSLSARRAWIEIDEVSTNEEQTESLSARRAWIEILFCVGFSSGAKVALRKESVDRNQAADISARRGARSLSARRAWIEINMWCNAAKLWVCRSPQGERG